MKYSQLFLFISIIALTPCLLTAQQDRQVDRETSAFLTLEKSLSSDVIDTWNMDHAPNLIESISRTRPYYKVTYTGITIEELSHIISPIGNIRTLKQSQPVEYRETFPDDNLFSEQWSLEQIGLPNVWDQTTGGTIVTSGEDIVIAIVDDGFNASHPDLMPNVWTNRQEVPNNGIDDDGNGYIDDYRGYNALSDNDQHDIKSHGTQVAGIAGAKGDNDLGITGVNWDVKILLVSGARFEAEVVESYEYIKAMKELYISSNGERGANIVATNFSGGISGLDESDNPEWCQLYNDLGNLGILSVGAVENSNVNYDTNLDLPTRCSSNFLIMTTNTDQIDAKVTSAGFSSTHVDLGAPGEDIPSLDSGSGYDNISGTSAAAPHVAGAIALLYSSQCQLFASDTSDEDVAMIVKSAVMESVTRVPSLVGSTVSGGRLDIENASLKMRELCGLSNEPLDLQIINSISTAGIIDVRFTTTSTEPVEVSMYTMQGRLVRRNMISQPSIFEENLISFDFQGSELVPGSTKTILPAVYVVTLDNGRDHTSKQFIVIE